MYQKSLPSFTIKLEKTKDAQKPDGTYPVILRIIFNRTQRRVRLGFSCLAHQFIDGHVKGVHDVERKNELIDESLERAKNIYVTHFKDNEFDYNLWLKFFKETKIQKNKKIGVLEFAMQIHDQKISMGKIKSAYDYKAINSLIRRFTNNKEVYFDELRGEHGKIWLKELEAWMLKQGLKGFAYMKHLKSLYTKLVKETCC